MVPILTGDRHSGVGVDDEVLPRLDTCRTRLHFQIKTGKVKGQGQGRAHGPRGPLIAVLKQEWRLCHVESQMDGIKDETSEPLFD